jgi:hypothetical protein
MTTFTFGRYKGLDIWHVVTTNINYIDWLYYQPWFKEKYPIEFNYLKDNWDYWRDIYAESCPMDHPCDYF